MRTSPAVAKIFRNIFWNRRPDRQQRIFIERPRFWNAWATPIVASAIFETRLV